MPHEYAILHKSPEQAWYVVEAMIRLSPASYRAYFNGAGDVLANIPIVGRQEAESEPQSA
ncbi:MAG: hypothetical protein M3406_01220 [Chloroflexota bacterium]|nr:hypothetical protein [Chloroflexota bacterium]